MWQLKGRLERRLGKGDGYNSPDQFGPTKKRIKEWILGDYRFRVAGMQQCAELTKQSHKEWVGGSGWRQRSRFSLSNCLFRMGALCSSDVAPSLHACTRPMC